MLNAVMLVKNRPKLTQQCLQTFLKNSRLDWNLTVIDDRSTYITQAILLTAMDTYGDKVEVLRHPRGCGVLGRLKNLGVYWSEKTFGRGEYLYVMDNDGYYTEGWDEKLVPCMMDYHRVGLAGPYRHPYHLPGGVEITIGIHGYHYATTDAVQGIGHLMPWDIWDKFGPYDANAQGTNQSEDYALCRRIVDAGYRVGSIQPNVVYNCGLTDSNGKPCVGIETMTDRVEGVYYE